MAGDRDDGDQDDELLCGCDDWPDCEHWEQLKWLYYVDEFGYG